MYSNQNYYVATESLTVPPDVWGFMGDCAGGVLENAHPPGFVRQLPPDAHRNGQSHHRLSQLFDMTKDHYSLRILGGLYHPRRCLKLP